MGVHDGHRKRLRNRFLREGLTGFDEHQVLEILLQYAIPRVDTNPIAHELLRRFDDIAGVFDAPYDELLKVPGIGENSATLIKLMPEIGRSYIVSKNKPGRFISSTAAAGSALAPLFFGEKDEVAYLMCLDAKNKLLCIRMIARGEVNHVSISIRRVVELALSFNASGVILAHNHVGGLLSPSQEDILMTRSLENALEAVGVRLRDHIVVADGEFISMMGMKY